MTPDGATALACSNIAFVKYWGNLDPALRLPFNDSVSMNLSAATTTTAVELDHDLQRDTVEVDGRLLTGAALERAVAQLDLIRARAGLDARARVVSRNTFPMGTGIASSASGFAALTLAAARACGLRLDEAQLSAIARRGSGSAARSVPGGFVDWHAAATDEASYARSLAAPAHWDLTDVVAVVSREHKAVGSSGGHAAALTSPHFAARLSLLPGRLAVAREAIAGRDLARLGPMIEEEALCLHAVALTSRPPLIYWTGATVSLLSQVARWRSDGLPVFFTLDAGPNVHLICEGRHAPAVESLARGLPYVESVLVNEPGGHARIVPPVARHPSSGDGEPERGA